MPRLVAVFDTNVYRCLKDDDLASLKASERQGSVVARPNYQVVRELLAHLADRDDRDFGSCYAALRRLAEHCRRFDGRRYILDFVADGLDQVAVSLFGRSLGEPAIAEGYAALVGDVANGHVSQDWEAYADVLGEIAISVRDSRAAFADAVQGIAKDIAIGFGFADGSLAAVLADPERRSVLCRAFDSDGAVEAVAQMIYRQITETLKPPPESPTALRTIIERYPTPLRFFNRVVKGSICDGWRIDGKKRLGVSYDIRISFVASGYANLDGSPVCLVSDDQLIHMAADVAGVGARVLDLASYRSLLGDPEAIRTWPAVKSASP